MNEHINPPCNSSLATSFINGMSSEEAREARKTAPFAAPGEVVEEGASEIDKRVVERSVSLDPAFVLSFDSAERKGVYCVRRALEQLDSEVISGTEPVLDADDEGEDTFVDVVGGRQRDEGAESENFTLADALMRANPPSETVLNVVVSLYGLSLC